MESAGFRIVKSDFQGCEKTVTQENMKVFLKPQVCLFKRLKYEEREKTKESGGRVIRDLIYILRKKF
jgi:hypothetical protein